MQLEPPPDATTLQRNPTIVAVVVALAALAGVLLFGSGEDKGESASGTAAIAAAAPAARQVNAAPSSRQSPHAPATARKPAIRTNAADKLVGPAPALKTPPRRRGTRGAA